LRTMRLYSAHSHSVCFVFLSPHPSAPSSLFPYTTLFRSCGPDDKIIDPIITAQAADTALDLENVGASFAITRRSDNTIGISARRSEEHTSELQSRFDLVCRLLLEKKKETQ